MSIADPHWKQNADSPCQSDAEADRQREIKAALSDHGRPCFREHSAFIEVPVVFFWDTKYDWREELATSLEEKAAELRKGGK